MQSTFDSIGNIFDSPVRFSMKPDVSILSDSRFSHTLRSAASSHPQKLCRELVELFANIYKKGSHNYQLMDMVQCYKDACKEQADLVRGLCEEGKLSRNLTRNELVFQHLWSRLEQESFTWELIHDLYMERLLSGEVESVANEDDEHMEIENVNKHSWIIPPRYLEEVDTREEMEVVKAAFQVDESLRIAEVVIHWLEKLAKLNIQRTWKAEEQFAGNYKHKEEGIFQLKNAIAKNPSLLGCNEYSLNIDYVLVEGREYVGKDKQDEERFLRHLFRLLLAGEVKKVQQLCMQVGDYTRAALFEGNTFCSSFGEGNPFHNLFVTTCLQSTKDMNLYNYDRAIYGYVSGDLDSLLSVCDTCYDVLWVYLRTWLIWRLKTYVAHNTRYAMNGFCRTLLPIKAVTSPFTEGNNNVDITFGKSLDHNLARLGELTLKELLQRIDAECQRRGFVEKMLNLSIFYQMQMAFIADDLKEMFTLLHDVATLAHFDEKFDRSLIHGREDRSSTILSDLPLESRRTDLSTTTAASSSLSLAVYLQRYAAHVALLLRRLFNTTVEHPDLDDSFCLPILHQFVSSIIEIQRQEAPQQPSHFVQLVALYAGTLKESMQVEIFSYFLEYVMDTDERIYCLDVAEKYDLNADAIISSIVQRIRDKYSSEQDMEIKEVLNSRKPQHLQPMSVNPLSSLDLLKVEAIGWLVIRPQHCLEAVQQTNAMCRDFLLSSKLEAASQVIMKLPERCIDTLQDLMEQHKDQSSSVVLSSADSQTMLSLLHAHQEYNSLKLYLEVRQSHTRFLSQKNTRSIGAKESLVEFAHSVFKLIRCRRWLCDDDKQPTTTQPPLRMRTIGKKCEKRHRLDQMACLRRLLLSDAVFLLVDAIIQSPLEMGQLAIDLVSTLMDKENGHERTLVADQLSALIDKVKKLCLKVAVMQADLSSI